MVTNMRGNYPWGMLSNITPFTYRDGYTWLELLEYLRRKLRQLVDKMRELIDYVNEQLENLFNYINEQIDILKNYVDEQDAALRKEINDLRKYVDQHIERLDGRINQLGDRVTKLEAWQTEMNQWRIQVDADRDRLNKLIADLIESGAWVDGGLAPNRHLATGNINVFGGTADGGSFIRTTKGAANNDITAGI